MRLCCKFNEDGTNQSKSLDKVLIEATVRDINNIEMNFSASLHDRKELSKSCPESFASLTPWLIFNCVRMICKILVVSHTAVIWVPVDA